MYEVFPWMYVCVLCACTVPWRPEKSVGSPGTVVTDRLEPPCGHWEWIPGPLGKQSLPFTTEPFLQPHVMFLILSVRGGNEENTEESEGITWLLSPPQQWLASPSRYQQVACIRSFVLLPRSQIGKVEWGGVRCELLTDTRLPLCPGSVQNLLDYLILRPWKPMPSSRERRSTGGRTEKLPFDIAQEGEHEGREKGSSHVRN